MPGEVSGSLDDPIHNRRLRRVRGGGRWGSLESEAGEDEFEVQAIKATPDLRATGKDFITVDWAYYEQKERDRKRRFDRMVAGLPFVQQQVLKTLDAGQSWVALLCVGFTTGAIASAIGIGCDWFSEVRYGLCTGKGFWVGRKECCGDAVSFAECEDWMEWRELAALSGVGGALSPNAEEWINFAG